jgi:hypothetical protein
MHNPAGNWSCVPRFVRYPLALGDWTIETGDASRLVGEQTLNALYQLTQAVWLGKYRVSPDG